MAGINDSLGNITLSRGLNAMGMASLTIDNASGTYDPLVGGLELDLNKQVVINAGYKEGGPIPEPIFKALVMDGRFGAEGSTRDEAQVRLGTIYKNLAKIPVHTLIYENINGQNLLNAIASSYARIPSTHYDFSAASGTTFTKVTIDEISCTDAFKRIAQACEVWIFEDKLGKLVAKAVPDDRAIDFVLTGTDEARVTHIASDIDYYNRVRVVGGYKAMDSFTERIVYNRVRTVDLVDEMDTLRFTCELNMLIQTAEGVTATLYWTTPAAPGVDVKIEELERDFVTVVITRKDELSFLGTVTVQIVVEGTPEPAYITLPGRSPVPGDDFITRVEGVANDPDGQAKYGANMELPIDNRYVQTEAHAEAVALFVLKQLKWGRHVLEVGMQYDPRFELGDSLSVQYKSIMWQVYIHSMTVGWDVGAQALEATYRCPVMQRVEV